MRYQPSAQVASVGGDWFDSFVQPDGGTILVIGDVVGHDMAAAAAMGQIRGLLRGIAWNTGEAPASVLRRLDAAIEGLQLSTSASAIVARLEASTDGSQEGAATLRWSNAGHPPPMSVSPAGAVTVLETSEADLLLGIDPRTPRAQSQVNLESGTTVLFYTDGLVERRGENLDVGLARLRHALGALADWSLEELCDELLRVMVTEADDDVALIAVRLNPQA